MFHSKASNDFPPLNRLRFLLFQCWSGIFQTMWYYPGDWIQIYCNPYAYMPVHTFSIHIKEPAMLSLTRDNQFERFVNNFTQAGGVGRTWRNRVDFTFLILTAFKIQRSNVIIVLKFYQASFMRQVFGDEGNHASSLRLVFTSDGVVVIVAIRRAERYDLVKIKPTESEAEHWFCLCFRCLRSSENCIVGVASRIGRINQWQCSVDSGLCDWLVLPLLLPIPTT